MTFDTFSSAEGKFYIANEEVSERVYRRVQELAGTPPDRLPKAVEQANALLGGQVFGVARDGGMVEWNSGCCGRDVFLRFLEMSS